MRILPMLLLMHANPDGGVSPEFTREVILAKAACLDADGGLPPVRIADCVITCVGEWGEARLVDGGVCFRQPKLVPAQEGDFWLPGQLPLQHKRQR